MPDPDPTPQKKSQAGRCGQAVGHPEPRWHEWFQSHAWRRTGAPESLKNNWITCLWLLWHSMTVSEKNGQGRICFGAPLWQHGHIPKTSESMEFPGDGKLPQMEWASHGYLGTFFPQTQGVSWDHARANGPRRLNSSKVRCEESTGATWRCRTDVVRRSDCGDPLHGKWMSMIYLQESGIVAINLHHCRGFDLV